MDQTALVPVASMSSADRAQLRSELRAAVARLEGSSLAMTLASKVGMPVEALLRFLPAQAQSGISLAVDRALQQCLRTALAFRPSPRRPGRRIHTVATAVTGAVGGFFGLPGLVVELPVTTTIMLHAIAQIAATNGEDLTQPEAALACLQVLALGPEGRRVDALESAYYATRAALAQVTRDAAAYLAQKGLAKEGAPALLSFLSKIAARFGLEVTEKAAAQLIPVAGAVGGIALNIVFTNHFQRIAEGHFAIRRLERKYGPTAVRHEYELVRTQRS
jgi:hypothetical protein